MSGAYYPPSGAYYPPTVSPELMGVAPATLQLWLTAAQTALNALQIGGTPQQVTYGQGDGQKSVTYTRTNMPQLRAYVRELQMALGVAPPRSAIRLGFSGRGDMPFPRC